MLRWKLKCVKRGYQFYFYVLNLAWISDHDRLELLAVFSLHSRALCGCVRVCGCGCGCGCVGVGVCGWVCVGGWVCLE